MASENTKLELRVGLFMLVGLVLLGYMVVVVGRFGTGIKRSYALTVELPNASGLLKNSKVLMSGAEIGRVVDSPRLLPNARGVAVALNVTEPTRIARNARVVIGSSGLMGDRFVDVLPPARDEGGYYAPGETVQGTRAGGMDDLTREGGKLLGDLRAAVANLNGTITRVNEDLLKPAMLKNLQDSVANLSATTGNFKAASEKLSGVLDDARGAVAQARGVVDGAKETLASAKTAADGAQKAIGDTRGAIGDARKVLRGVGAATDEAVHGPGLLGTLISDHSLSDNVAALVSNLRRSGVVFYKDRPAPTPEPRERQKAEGRR